MQWFFGAAKFQVDVKEGGGGGVWPKRPVDVKRGESEYVDGPEDTLGETLKYNVRYPGTKK